MIAVLGVLHVILMLAVVGFRVATIARRGATNASGATQAREAAIALGGKGSLDSGSALVIPFEDREFQLTGSRYAKGGPQQLHLGTTVARPEGPRAASAFRDKPSATASMPRLAHVILRRESAKDGWGKRLGLNVEPQTGDAAFDDAIYVEHDGDRIGTKYLLAIPELRARILEIVDDHTSVTINDEGHAVALRWSVGAGPPTPMVLRDAALKLGRIADAIPPVKNLEVRPRGRVTVATVLSASAGALGFVVMILTMLVLGRAPVDTSFFRAALVASLGLIGIAGVVAWTVAKGRSRGLALFSWSLLAAVAVSPFFSALTLILVNGAGVAPDRSERVALHVYSRSGKSGRSCYASVSPWRAGLTLVRDSRISCTLVGGFKQPTTGAVKLGHGRLGWEWIDDVEINPAE